MTDITVDLPVTYARIVEDGVSSFVTTLGDEDTTGEIVMTVTGDTHVYPIKFDDGPDVTVVLPDPPAGYALTDAHYVALAYREADTGGGDSSGFGYNPNPDNAPYMLANTSDPFTIDYLPVGGYDGVVAGRGSEDLSLLATGAEGNYNGDAWTVGNIVGGTDGVIHLAYLALRLVYSPTGDLPCDTWVDLDLSTAMFADTDATVLGQYVDGVITGLDGSLAEYWFPTLAPLDPTKRYRVEVTYDPTSPHDGDGDPATSDRFVLLRDAQPVGTDPGADSVQIGDGFSNTADVCLLTIGPGIGNWDDPDFGIAAGWDTLLFQTSFSGAVSAIRIRKVCKTVPPPLRLTNRRYGGSGATSLQSLYDRQGGLRLTGPL